MGIWIGLGIVAVLFVVVLMWFMGMYNMLIRRRVDCDNGWSQIDVQLKRRHDLIPNLVETVKGYASHEKETLQGVIAARSQAVSVHDDSSKGVADQARAEGELTQALGRLFAVAEAYPDLKANQGFGQLQEELSSTENKISFSRQHYNDTVGRYETTRQVFPTNIIAGFFNFKPREYFELDSEAERAVPKVSFS